MVKSASGQELALKVPKMPKARPGATRWDIRFSEFIIHRLAFLDIK